MRYDSLKLVGDGLDRVQLPTASDASVAGSLYATKDSIFVSSGGGWDEVPISIPLDPFRAQVKSLLHFDGNLSNAVAATPMSTIVGGSIDTNIAKFGSGSGKLLDVNSYCTVPQVGWALGIFTLEFWLYATAELQTCRLFATAHPNYAGSGRVLDMKLSNGFVIVSGLDKTGAGTGITQNTVNRVLSEEWTHVAFVADGQVGEIFVNGISGGKANYRDAVGLTVPDSARIGFNGAAFGTQGNFLVDEFCYTNAKRYTADFTPPTHPYRLT